MKLTKYINTLKVNVGCECRCILSGFIRCARIEYQIRFGKINSRLLSLSFLLLKIILSSVY